MRKIKEIKVITGEIELLSGLHIGGGDSQMKIGGIDNEVIKDVAGNPFIPGSSLKGKIRTLLEWHLGFYNADGKPSNQDLLDEKPNDPLCKTKNNLLKLFGYAPSKDNPGIITRLSFWDCKLKKSENNLEKTEAKMENSINRTSGTADNPRSIERVAVGNKFEFNLTIKIFEDDNEDELLNLINAGLQLLELDALGGSGSRGYGKIQFNDLKYDGKKFPFNNEYLKIFTQKDPKDK